ncbi:MAG TPA: type II toxin-antitoxin system PemK/MazF family toxin [Candidatus Desulfofervidus auxilii]|uniref:Type II toxin-antitoxin system PemK/MazF family toxin n=1 Tax=Desulfofervidus auxilii TaxID=1621989 RepID=A0A7C1VWF8_DESA2|nr:type II toxin-antitoxin system PemK/MazF family toxin [Candidatus Desulfofervidus auxilii]
MSYKKGDIVVVKFPFLVKGKGEVQKGRPALVICDDKVEKRYKDVILAAITSHIPENIMEMELILEPIETTGLVKKSLLRLDFLMTIPEELISRKIGRLPENLIIEVEHKLRKLFGINITYTNQTN